ncbi:MAG: hypothetical protein LC101_12380 [Flavobacteriales bacterium]|nr:hypothetical protein [Flavobacteriales bacterium]MCZ2444560.1 hypothetical protein [Flavobacteriales bacterium]
MNRRYFVRNSALVGGAIAIAPHVGISKSLFSSNQHPIFIDLGRIRIQDILGNNSAMPLLVEKLTEKKLSLQTTTIKSTQETYKPSVYLQLQDQVSHLSHQTDINVEAGLCFDEALLKQAIETADHAAQALYISLSNTDIAHSNPDKYVSLLNNIDKLLSAPLDTWIENKREVHIFSSGGRNLLHNDLGGWDHSDTDPNALHVFHFFVHPENYTFGIGKISSILNRG